MTFESIDMVMDDGLARVTLNQAEQGNPFNATLCREWLELANALASERTLRAILITARGKYFSVGGDIRMFTRNLDVLPERIREWTGTLHAGIARIARLDAPTVVAVHGVAMGGAVGLVASCDLVYASGSASFGAAYPSIGYSCDAGSSKALASRMGVSRGKRFLLCNETLDVSAAADCGLVDFVVDAEALQADAEAAARRFANGPTQAYGDIRRLFSNVMQQSLEAQLEDEAQSLARMAGTEDAREGILAFSEKRRPTFKGR
ncbi:enoyl-CoA hydratase/isomerase family protein [Denitromonas ohlonensis]|uniref:Enoyl-CoA hydratase/isomerase family protein n=2 Tax=Denitromonas TaxID=139331 RepID=A0A558EB94_9RHOO|nr:enoyl-CoA hydratase-related protein [Denitromonas ohlonensis]TVO63498.1 enoyl-CoA hydratase/isomerase family protein [Denitromonas ohlonensis]TVO75375.1 enoyl-CoA hydratase/isomerase family protein [Denitromonas ohlonensis]TVT70626.1 MAG: enoyl-CoA hydratase/isomerase family protein [Denitromonas halophila]